MRLMMIHWQTPYRETIFRVNDALVENALLESLYEVCVHVSAGCARWPSGSKKEAKQYGKATSGDEVTKRMTCKLHEGEGQMHKVYG